MSETDITERLLDAADRIDELDRSELQVLLRQAVADIRLLRDLVGIRQEIELEDAEPQGHG